MVSLCLALAFAPSLALAADASGLQPRFTPQYYRVNSAFYLAQTDYAPAADAPLIPGTEPTLEREVEIVGTEVMGPPAPVYTSIYSRPYSLWESNTNGKQLGRNTLVLFGLGLGAMGGLYLMPSSITNWEDDGQSPFSKWWHNVSRPPVWDEDDWFLNYITHPYAGGVYYMGARSTGANALYSTFYSFAISTFFWEYGIEAFAERPSIQDLIVTPAAGAIVGEGFYLLKRHIVDNDYRLFSSKVLGVTTAFLMDPMTEITDLVWGDSKKPETFALQAYPMITDKGKVGGCLTWNISF